MSATDHSLTGFYRLFILGAGPVGGTVGGLHEATNTMEVWKVAWKACKPSHASTCLPT